MNTQAREMTLPVDGDTLWPQGKLLQIQHLNPGEVKRLSLKSRVYLVLLTRGQFTIAEQLNPEAMPLIRVSEEPLAYDFYDGPLREVHSLDTKEITRVAISTSLLHNFMVVWARGPKGQKKRILCLESHPSGIPHTIFSLVDEGMKRGILGPHRATGLRAVFAREIERQFRRAAPQADITLRGQRMPEEIFRKLVR
jgi:hypothetical protein